MTTHSAFDGFGHALAALLITASAAQPATLYVSLSGNDRNDGAEPARAWRTVAHAASNAKAGDTVYIKAGDYGREEVVVKHSGSEGSPIVFEGYAETPGDRPFPADYEPGDPLDPALMPVLDGQGDSRRAIHLRGKEHVQFRNIGITRYDWGIFPLACKHITMDHIVALTFCHPKSHHNGCGIYPIDCEHCSITNCIVADATMDNIVVRRSHHVLVENCRTYGTLEHRTKRTDYYIVLVNSSDCVVRNCLAHNLHPRNGGGHGIGIKDHCHGKAGYRAPHSQGNKIVNCVVRNSGEHLFVAHGAHHNEFRNCTVECDWKSTRVSWNQGINVRDGAHDNVFANCRVGGLRYGLVFVDTVEGPKGPDKQPVTQITENNRFVGCVFHSLQTGLMFWNARSNVIENCVLADVATFLLQFPDGLAEDNLVRNSIMCGIGKACTPRDSYAPDRVRFVHSTFWNSAFPTPAGPGNMTRDPLFAAPAEKDFRLRSAHGRWDPRSGTWVRDAATSPCIDAGDPETPFSAEPRPNGDRANSGAYGNTAEASKSAP